MAPLRGLEVFVAEGNWIIKELDVKTKKVTDLIKTLPGSEDYAWMPGGIILMGQGGKLFKWNSKIDKEWIEIMDFSAADVKNFYRIAVSSKGDYIALVAFRGERQ